MLLLLQVSDQLPTSPTSPTIIVVVVVVNNPNCCYASSLNFDAPSFPGVPIRELVSMSVFSSFPPPPVARPPVARPPVGLVTLGSVMAKKMEERSGLPKSVYPLFLHVKTQPAMRSQKAELASEPMVRTLRCCCCYCCFGMMN